jgi:hypothetical protein
MVVQIAIGYTAKLGHSDCSMNIRFHSGGNSTLFHIIILRLRYFLALLQPTADTVGY